MDAIPQQTVPAADLRIAGVTKAFAGTRVLHGIDLAIPDGTFVALLGPSGCGKTTLLRIIAGLESADGGTVHLGGRDLLTLPANRRPVNTVFQSYALFPHLRVEDNVAFGLRARGVAATEVRRRVDDMLALMRLGDFARRHPHQLSGGQRQRVALARALVNEPEVLLLDEPMSALDARLRVDLQGELRRLQRRCGTTFVLVTHDQDEAIAVADRLVIMDQGRIVQDGTPEAVYERPRTRFVADFIGRANLIAVSSWTTVDGALRADTDLGSVVLPETPAWASGDVAIRPEDVEIHVDGAADRLPGRIEERLFRGDQWELVVAVGTTRLRVVAGPDEPHQEGAAVWIALPPADLVVLEA